MVEDVRDAEPEQEGQGKSNMSKLRSPSQRQTDYIDIRKKSTFAFGHHKVSHTSGR